jgi:hypothetical protein
MNPDAMFSVMAKFRELFPTFHPFAGLGIPEGNQPNTQLI